MCIYIYITLHGNKYDGIYHSISGGVVSTGRMRLASGTACVIANSTFKVLAVLSMGILGYLSWNIFLLLLLPPIRDPSTRHTGQLAHRPREATPDIYVSQPPWGEFLRLAWDTCRKAACSLLPLVCTQCSLCSSVGTSLKRVADSLLNTCSSCVLLKLRF